MSPLFGIPPAHLVGDRGRDQSGGARWLFGTWLMRQVPGTAGHHLGLSLYLNWIDHRGWGVCAFGTAVVMMVGSAGPMVPWVRDIARWPR